MAEPAVAWAPKTADQTDKVFQHLPNGVAAGGGWSAQRLVDLNNVFYMMDGYYNYFLDAVSFAEQIDGDEHR
jgi:hypothetical protein